MFGSGFFSRIGASDDATRAYSQLLEAAHVANLAAANSAAITALGRSNGLSEQQAWAASMWAEVNFEAGR